MPEKKKCTKLPVGATKELKAAEGVKKQWTEEAECLADRLADSEWRSYSARPRGESSGYFVILHWYVKEKMWMPLYLQHGSVTSQLAKIFSNKEATPICKYLSSFPRSQRKLLCVKWVLDSSMDSGMNKPLFKEVLQAFSTKYNHGEILAFNMDEEQSDVPENFSLLDY